MGRTRNDAASLPGRGTPMASLYEESGGMRMCRRLSEQFHSHVTDDPILRPLFPKNLVTVTERLALFVAERLGGPQEYTRLRGKQSMTCRHAHLAIGLSEAEAWMGHMRASMDEIGVPEPARHALDRYFTQTIGAVSDPFLTLYTLPLTSLRAELEKRPGLACACKEGRTLLNAAAGQWGRAAGRDAAGVWGGADHRRPPGP